MILRVELLFHVRCISKPDIKKGALRRYSMTSRFVYLLLLNEHDLRTVGGRIKGADSRGLRKSQQSLATHHG
jgi:hypothetical protein